MANKSEYTHYAKFYGIPCYFNENDNSLDGVNFIWSKLLDFAIFIEKLAPSNDYGFPIQITGEIEKDIIVK